MVKCNYEEENGIVEARLNEGDSSEGNSS